MMEDWERAAIRACELKRVIDTMEAEYNSVRKKIVEQWEQAGLTAGEVVTALGTIKVRLDERTSITFDDEVMLKRIGRERYIKLASISPEKARAALKLGFLSKAELEGATTETVTRHITVRCP